MTTQAQARSVGPGDGRVLVNPIGGRMVLKIPDALTAGAYSVHDNLLPPHSPGPRPHLHRDHEETFYVLEGELTVQVEGDPGGGRGVRGDSTGAGASAVQPDRARDPGAADLLSGWDGPLLRGGG